jgi:hypothetical protein
MAYTINLDDDFISAEELQLTQTKQAILEKLRVHFGEYSNRDGWAAHRAEIEELPKQHQSQSR